MTHKFTRNVVSRGVHVTATATASSLKLNIDPISRSWILVTVISISTSHTACRKNIIVAVVL